MRDRGMNVDTDVGPVHLKLWSYCYQRWGRSVGRAGLRTRVGHIKSDMLINIQVETPARQLDMQNWALGIRPR